jgi:hypothetical protein
MVETAALLVDNILPQQPARLRFVGDDDGPPSQQICEVSMAQIGPTIEPDGVLFDFTWPAETS